ncbi:hypothetical protein KPH14_005753 [Odynerus spinipes]|uniref:FYVE-type domain-containing protein n=1 Tax=Odynerus spinipes TaxID=1348599 RepID=A0AAD9RB49_9HYME|nr:hypothetical protein KPH14_005753 [Odynerus spinipes]
MSAIWGRNKTEATSPAIMESLDSLSIYNRDMYNTNRSSTAINANTSEGLPTKNETNRIESFLLIDKQERLKVSNAEQFIKKLNCIGKDQKVKVVSIFGNTGDGKSHTLNQTFFKGQEVFRTSNDQTSCTMGVWAAFDPSLNVICLDTEGITIYENERIRLLLKVLAISDIVIYRTRSERLNKDLFVFLSTASQAYNRHFWIALQAMGQRAGIPSSLNSLGPTLIILQETKHTKPLSNNGSESAEDILRTRFGQMRLEIESFSKLKYVGIQTVDSPTNYEPLRIVIKNELENTSVRFARHPQLVYSTLRHLNDKFSGEVGNFSSIIFPDQYFSCPVKCLSCGCRCSNSMGHLRDGKPHSNNAKCRYQHQYDNIIYICKRCYSNGKEVKVTSRIQTHNDKSWYGLAVYAWYGSIIECPHCGEIYRSRQYWYGNKDPEEVAVCTEVTHVWMMPAASNVPQNTAQRVVDGVSYITEAVTNVSLQPTKALSAWVTDQIAPSYWRPNNEIKSCYKCKTPFGATDTKHHCRACGEGFCAQCSSQTKCVPSKNWYTPVRVCDICYSKDTNSNDEVAQPIEDVSARKVTEHVVSTLSAVGTVLNYSKSFIKDTVRPSYWVPDSEVTGCCICNQKFSATLSLHHCRDCGRGVCQECSQHRKPVPHRGWDKPVRVCDSCMKID